MWRYAIICNSNVFSFVFVVLFKYKYVKELDEKPRYLKCVVKKNISEYLTVILQLVKGYQH